ncbi:MAG: ABC transporter ATP-binding protein [Balneolaceae bacterium]
MIIKIKNLKKSFGERPVLKGMDLSVPEGQATGIVGPNGSGKTTLIKSLLGLVRPDSGSIEVKGVKLNGNWEYRQNIGYMPQVARYPENMKVYELFDFIEGLRNRVPVFKDELIEQFNLGPELEKPLRVLSGGNRQKVGATLAMMFDPQLLFLDEPTAGLDPQASYQFKEWVRREKVRGKTILITSHIMSELEQLADHLVFILEGSIRYYGTMKNLLEENREEHLEGAIARMMEVSNV